jgi:serine/threonine-protein kinase
MVPYVLEATIPTFICAGLAIMGSRVVYGLTRDLSKAQQLGSYQLVQKIGAGGMGEVWKAKHRLLARPAAIKFIKSDALSRDRAAAATALQRFEREAQATSGLSSQHSIDLYDFGITDDGTFYYVMELLEGVDLRTLVERYGPVPPGRAIHIHRQACDSLEDAHYVGVVHRDIKPGNIFLCRKGPEYDFVKVLDFGLVKQIGASGRKSAQLTVEGIASGTPAFMAPEMAYDSRVVDGRADLYALGCVAYWLLTGQLVFSGESPMGTMLRHVNDAPPPPSSRTELEIPADLERIILACLEKDPDKRPPSARELSRLLAECERSVTPWDPERMQHWWQTHFPDLGPRPADRESTVASTTA